MLSKIVKNMARVIFPHIPRFQDDSSSPLGGVCGLTDTQTDRHTEGFQL